MKKSTLRLIDYDHWANVKILDAITHASAAPPRTLELFSHILAVSSIWLSRAKGESEVAKRFDLYSLQECETSNHRMHLDWKSYIDSLNNIEATITFTMQGQRMQTTVLDCLNHVLFHGSYHRGQIVTLLKGHVPELPMTDYVLFATEKTGGS